MTTIDRDILRLALPSIVSNITVPLLGLCDVTIMGHIGGASSIGAIAVGSMIFNVMYWLFVFLRMSTSGLTAQAYGGRRWEEARAIRRRGLLSALAVGGAMVVLQVPLRWLAFWLFQADGEVAVFCKPYYDICIWGAPAVLGGYVLMGWFVGMQNTRYPMAIAIGQNVVNIALSLLLVVGFGMGIRGLAVGTLVAQWGGFLAALALAPSCLSLRGGKETVREIPGVKGSFGLVRLEGVLFLRTLCLVSVNLYFTSAGAAQGALILAANTLLMQFFMVYSYMMDGFANAGEALAGRYLGAADGVMLRLTVRRLFGWGVAVALLFTVVYWLCGASLLHLFTTDAAVVLVAQDYLPWAVLIPVAGLGAFVWDGIFIGTTLSRGMLLSCFIAAVAFFALWLLFSPSLHNHALWLALLVYLALRGLVQTVYWRNR